MSAAILKFAELWRLDSGATFAETMEDWQRDFLCETTALSADGIPNWRRVLLSVARQSGKTELLSLLGCYRLLTSGGCVLSAAQDLDQARHQAGRLVRAIRRSDVLSREFDTGGLKGDRLWTRDQRAYWQFMPNDLSSSGGHVPGLLLVDEVGQFGRDGWPFLAQISPSPTIQNGQTIFAGFKGALVNRSPGCVLFDLLKQAEEGAPDLLCVNYEGASPSKFHDDAFLERQRAALPLCVYQQLYENRWAESESQFLTVRMIEGAVDESLNHGGEAREGEAIAMGLDLGLVSDRSVLSAVGISRNGEARLLRQKVWAGSADCPVDLGEVQDAVAEMYWATGACLCVVDPWQGMQCVQSLAAAGVAVEVFKFTAGSVELLAGGLYGLFSRGLIRIPNDEDLKSELLGLTIKATVGGYKWVHASGAHDDRVTSLALAASPLFAQQFSITDSSEPEEILFEAAHFL